MLIIQSRYTLILPNISSLRWTTRWPLTQGLKNKLVTCKMRLLRKAVNKRRRDKIRNEVIRAQVGATPVLQHVENQQFKWFGHLMRMPTDQPAHRAYNSRYSGKRPRGRPR
ncbi:hypothetical protein ElyMa_006308400 [Elysia marginata]|uniref:Uncharacterized protein n=1 Tax=Elysia marginata TaxID=1093978 RepID=A0AAV4HHC9_9GAST|nr:hypothetical protein ElyMa_006308400 [Elysia marginata]